MIREDVIHSLLGTTIKLESASIMKNGEMYLVGLKQSHVNVRTKLAPADPQQPPSSSPYPLLLIQPHSSSQTTTSTHPTSPSTRNPSTKTPPQPALRLSIFQKLFIPSLIPSFLLFLQFHLLFIISLLFTWFSPLLDLLRTGRNRR